MHIRSDGKQNFSLRTDRQTWRTLTVVFTQFRERS